MNQQKTTDLYQKLCSQLSAEMNQEGYWTGQLSTSALSTAVAIVALKIANQPGDSDKVASGFDWLCQHINADGGYGDTAGSLSNMSTTLLCYAAISYCQHNNNGVPVLKKMEKWLTGNGIRLDSETITRSILKFYGKDYTFSIPILSMLTLCGVLPPSSLRKIPTLPFEFTLLPSSWYRFVNLRVVSYALPALIAVGIYLHVHLIQTGAKKGRLRNLFIPPALKKLDQLVPPSGGFLEAIPLTGFVAMCLITCNYTDNRTVETGLRFLRIQQREDGGWPIDTDLSTWVTTLSIKALGPQLKTVLDDRQQDRLRDHLLDIQFKSIHPFNGAKPGGWGWTSFPGSVPDADDTPGAILALLELYSGSEKETEAVFKGCEWLIGLQNKDGGFPTFCKGWGRLPFDKSCADLTGHALLALLKSKEMLYRHISPSLASKTDQCIRKALRYLTLHQTAEGAWLPLWFGNQHTQDKTNPVYGTAKVCTYLTDCLEFQHISNSLFLSLSRSVRKAQQYLMKQQNQDGSWGGMKDLPGSLEETALAVCALATEEKEACWKGFQWLEKQEKMTASPIGLYFAMLWYDEKLYPVIYYIEALRRFLH